MTESYQGWDETFKAAGDLSAAQFHFVKLSAAGTVTTCDGATDVPVGVLQNKPNAINKAATVRIWGLTKVVLGGTIAFGNAVGTDGSGHCIVKSVDKDHIVGRCLGAGGDATNIVQIALGVATGYLAV